MKKVLSLVAAIMLLGTTAMAQASFGLGYMTPNPPVPDDALNGTTALNMMALMKGAHILRVHDVRVAVEAVKIYEKTIAAQAITQ